MVVSLASLFASVLVYEAGGKGPALGCATLGSSSSGTWSCWFGLWGLKTLSFLPELLSFGTLLRFCIFSQTFLCKYVHLSLINVTANQILLSPAY